jgi:hypothetical protein
MDYFFKIELVAYIVIWKKAGRGRIKPERTLRFIILFNGSTVARFNFTLFIDRPNVVELNVYVVSAFVSIVNLAVFRTCRIAKKLVKGVYSIFFITSIGGIKR